MTSRKSQIRPNSPLCPAKISVLLTTLYGVTKVCPPPSPSYVTSFMNVPQKEPSYLFKTPLNFFLQFYDFKTSNKRQHLIHKLLAVMCHNGHSKDIFRGGGGGLPHARFG